PRPRTGTPTADTAEAGKAGKAAASRTGQGEGKGRVRRGGPGPIHPRKRGQAGGGNCLSGRDRDPPDRQYVRPIVEREGALVAFASVPERHFGDAAPGLFGGILGQVLGLDDLGDRCPPRARGLSQTEEITTLRARAAHLTR